MLFKERARKRRQARRPESAGGKGHQGLYNLSGHCSGESYLSVDSVGHPTWRSYFSDSFQLKHSLQKKVTADIDLAKLRFQKGKLYGRSREIRALQHAFEHVQNKSSKVRLLEGSKSSEELNYFT